jgi:hypothetical protein
VNHLTALDLTADLTVMFFALAVLRGAANRVASCLTYWSRQEELSLVTSTGGHWQILPMPSRVASRLCLSPQCPFSFQQATKIVLVYPAR